MRPGSWVKSSDYITYVNKSYVFSYQNTIIILNEKHMISSDLN